MGSGSWRVRVGTNVIHYVVARVPRVAHRASSLVEARESPRAARKRRKVALALRVMDIGPMNPGTAATRRRGSRGRLSSRVLRVEDSRGPNLEDRCVCRPPDGAFAPRGNHSPPGARRPVLSGAVTRLLPSSPFAPWTRRVGVSRLEAESCKGRSGHKLQRSTSRYVRPPPIHLRFVEAVPSAAARGRPRKAPVLFWGSCPRSTHRKPRERRRTGERLPVAVGRSARSSTGPSEPRRRCFASRCPGRPAPASPCGRAPERSCDPAEAADEVGGGACNGSGSRERRFGPHVVAAAQVVGTSLELAHPVP